MTGSRDMTSRTVSSADESGIGVRRLRRRRGEHSFSRPAVARKPLHQSAGLRRRRGLRPVRQQRLRDQFRHSPRDRRLRVAGQRRGILANEPAVDQRRRVQAGNSPGQATFGTFAFDPDGVSNYNFVINNATGTAGPSPDSSDHVSGWSLANTVNFIWAADADNKLTVNLETLVNPATPGDDVAGAMDNFDPTQSYSWAAVHWTGTYTGPTDSATLTDSTVFNAANFQNTYSGTFGWRIDLTSDTLYLTYTPAP